MTSRLFGVGIGGTSITEKERNILERRPPWAVMLFRRNLEAVEQIRALTREIGRLPGPPLLCVDQEGGSVDRFRDALAPSISWREAVRRNRAREAGELAGEACATLGFQIDLAPVVDRMIEGASSSVLRDRSAAADPQGIATAARAFLDALESRGVGGCVKHFPGLGRAALDTHEHLPLLSEDRREEQQDLFPFAATMEQAGAVMISHAAGRDGQPASLSRAKAHTLLREELRFSGAAFSDDLEMGALSAFGDLPRRCVLAALAGCDLLLVCSRVDAYSECVAAVERDVPETRRAQASARLDAYAAKLGRLRAAAPLIDRSITDLIADIDRLRTDAGQKA